jgi:hypothetical protein
MNELFQQLKSKGLTLELIDDHLVLRGEIVDTLTLEKIKDNKGLLKEYLKSQDGTDKPYVARDGELVIPFDSDPRYHYWNGGQSIDATLKELGAGEKIAAKYYN